MAAAVRDLPGGDGRPRARLVAWLVGVLASLWAALAAAHPMPESRIWVDTAAHGITLTLQLPLNRLEFAFGQPLADAPQQALERHRDALAGYLLRHVGARSGQAGWQVLRPRLAVVGSDASAELEAVFELCAPPGGDARSFTLLYDAITHEVRTHRGAVYLRNDWAAGHVGEAPRLLGEVSAERTTLPVEFDQEARVGASVLTLLKHGARHIAEGLDHLLFLLTLMLVAPLIADAGRWRGVRRPMAAVRRLVAVVTAFTVGHSLTLALGSSGVLALPVQWVEAGVAASIIVAAVHACRPLARQGELLMAGGFGLLHGLAFSASLSGAGLTWGQQAMALLAFNAGIEAMQLAVVLSVVPPLLVLVQAAPRVYAGLRVAVAAFAATAAAAWLVERLEWSQTGVAAWVEAAAPAAPAAAAVLWAAALIAWTIRQRAGVRRPLREGDPGGDLLTAVAGAGWRRRRGARRCHCGSTAPRRPARAAALRTCPSARTDSANPRR